MNRIFVLKDVAYAAKEGGGTIAGYTEINSLTRGALAFFTENGALITAANAATVLPDTRTVQIASGRSKDTSLVSLVPRAGVTLNRADYRAFVKKVITVGALPVVDLEEGSIRVSDISYTSKYNVRNQSGSDYKLTSKTVTQSIDNIVSKLNAAGSWITATKTGTTPDFSIAITPKEEDVDISVALGGSFALAPITVTTKPVYGIGRAVDVAQMEKDFSTEVGNGNYQELTDLWNTTPIEADSSANYSMLTILWEGTHSSPTVSKNVMKNRAILACVNGAAKGQAVADIVTLTTAIFGGANTSATGVETGADSATAHDGVAGN